MGFSLTDCSEDENDSNSLMLALAASTAVAIDQPRWWLVCSMATPIPNAAKSAPGETVRAVILRLNPAAAVRMFRCRDMICISMALIRVVSDPECSDISGPTMLI